MPKKKNAMALFEAISKSKAKRSEDVTVPAWIGKNQAAPPNAAGQPGAPSAVQAPPVGAAPAAAAPAPGNRSAKPARVQTTWQTAVDPQGPSQDVVTVSTTRKTAALIVLGLVLVILAAVMLGRWSAKGPAAPVSDNAGAGKLGADKNPVPAGRIKGKHYLVIQLLGGVTDKDRADANSIAEFCCQNGEPAEVVTFPAGFLVKGSGPRTAVWSRKAYDTAEPEKAATEAQAVEKLGKQYLKEHGDYSFGQHDSKGQLDPMLPKFEKYQ